jgi:hypothetical protein
MDYELGEAPSRGSRAGSNNSRPLELMNVINANQLQPGKRQLSRKTGNNAIERPVNLDLKTMPPLPPGAT